MVADVKALVGAVQPAARVGLLVNPVQGAGLASLYTTSVDHAGERFPARNAAKNVEGMDAIEPVGEIGDVL